MKLQYSGEERIPASGDKVWAFVTDPEKVGRCLPEVEEVTVRDPTHFDATVKVGVGPVRGKFKVKVEMVPDPAGHRVSLTISGGGFGSTVDVAAHADLVDTGDGSTLLQWTGAAEARGPVAAVGGRVLDSEAHKLIAQAFGNVRQQLSP